LTLSVPDLGSTSHSPQAMTGGGLAHSPGAVHPCGIFVTHPRGKSRARLAHGLYAPAEGEVQNTLQMPVIQSDFATSRGSSNAKCAAASLATGTRKGEQET